MLVSTARTSSDPSGQINAIRQYAVYDPGSLPPVELSLLVGDVDVTAWVPARLRMQAEHEDGSRTLTVEYDQAGRRLVDTFPERRVRQASRT